MKANFETIFETKDRKTVSVQIGKNCVKNIQFVSILFFPWFSVSEERSQQEQDWPRAHEILNDHQLDVIKGLIQAKFAVKVWKAIQRVICNTAQLKKKKLEATNNLTMASGRSTGQ